MQTILNYDKIPGIFPIYVKAFFSRKRGFRSGDPFPKITAIVKDITIDLKKLNSYREVCELEDDGHLPILYPHVITAPLHMAILSHKDFPIPLAGMLHFRNHLIQHRPIKPHEKLNAVVKLDEHRIVKQGFEFDYTIHIESEGELVWNSITTYLKKGKFGTDFTSSHRNDLIKPVSYSEKFIEHHIPKYIGKRYARICSDYNPIHISRFAAKIFGFKRDIAHAMWAVAHSLGKLKLKQNHSSLRIDLGFKGPLFIESKSIVKHSEKKDVTRFDYYIEGNERPCINGKVSYVDKGSLL